MKKIVFLSLLALILSFTTGMLYGKFSNKTVSNVPKISPSNSPSPTPTPIPLIIPTNYEIPIRTHVFQHFNNCGPASLSMALSYFDVYVSQEELGRQLRPYQVANGDNDDKSVTLTELKIKAEELGFAAFHRPNGNIDILTKFISQDIPVITRTLTHLSEDIGHYRVVRGYSKTSIIQDDSLQGKGLFYTYEEFLALWKEFNFEYLVIVPKGKIAIAKQILGSELDEKVSWQTAATNSEKALLENPDDIYARFNLSVALYNSGNYKRSVQEFEKVEAKLPFRTLWYQVEPILAYYELGEYDKVFQITDKILQNQNLAFSELYIIRGDIYSTQGNLDLAKKEYEKAVFYNTSLKQAQIKLNEIEVIN